MVVLLKQVVFGERIRYLPFKVEKEDYQDNWSGFTFTFFWHNPVESNYEKMQERYSSEFFL
jgi:hypothetical protein